MGQSDDLRAGAKDATRKLLDLLTQHEERDTAPECSPTNSNEYAIGYEAGYWRGVDAAKKTIALFQGCL